MNSIRRLTAGLALAILPLGASAQTTDTWINDAGGVWSDAGSWSNGAPPTAIALITSNGAYTITLDQDVTLGTIRMWALSPTVVVPAGFCLSLTNNGGVGGNNNNGMSMASGATTLLIDGGTVSNRSFYAYGQSRIVITNGGQFFVGAQGQTRVDRDATVTQEGGLWDHSDTLEIAYDATVGAVANVILRGGNALFRNDVQIGARQTGVMTIDGATVTNLANLTVGARAPSTYAYATGLLNLASGTLVQMRSLFIGSVDWDSANRSQFTQTGGTYRNITNGNAQIRVGNNSTGALHIADGTFTATNGVGFNVGNVAAARGVGYVTNSGGTMRIGSANLMKGGWLVNGGTVLANGTLFATNAAVLQFDSGLLSVGGLVVSNGLAMTVGDGLSPATLVLRGTSSFADGLALSNGSELIISNTAAHSLTGDISGNAGLLKTGPGLMVLRGANTYAGGTTLAAGVLEAASTAALPGYDTPGTVVVHNGATLAVLAAGEAGQWTAGDIDTLLGSAVWDPVSGLGIDVPSNTFVYSTALTGARSFMKLGAGTLTLDGANTYSGSTAVRNGTLILGTSAQLSATADLLLGDPHSTTGAGTLDLNGTSQTVSKLFSVGQTNSNSTVTNSIVNLAAGQALNVVTSVATRSVHVQDGTHLRIAGAGALNVTNTPGRILVWGQRSSDGTTYRGLDLSGLGSFSANVNELVVGYDESGASQASRQALFALAGTNTIRAATAVYVGLSTVDGSVRGRMLLGVSNRLDTANLRIGYGKGTGWLSFQDGLDSPSLVLAGPGGTDRANISLGEFTSTASGTQPSGSLVLTNADATVVANVDQLLAGSLNVSGGNATAGGRGTMEFSVGTFDVNTVILGRTAAGATNGMASGSLTMNGGTLAVNTAFTLGQMNGSRPATGTFILSGGVATLFTDLADGGGTSAVTVAGGTLDMQGNAIGSAGNPIDTLTLQSGTLRNVAEINGGAAWAKTGPGVLTMEGFQAYSGPLSVDQGTLQFDGIYTSVGLITVQSGASLSGIGTVDDVTVLDGGALKPGTSAGTLTVGDLTLSAGVTLEYDLGTNSDLVLAGTVSLGGVEFNDFVFLLGPGFGPGVYTLIDATDIGGLGATTTGTVGAFNAELSIDDGNQDLLLTVIPEPGALGMLGLLAIAALLRRRGEPECR
jgi:autotransporter-associated beta strand protein